MSEHKEGDHGIKPQRCPVCSQTSNLLLCGGCKVVSYCGVEHQTSDRPSHKSVCKEVKKTREKLEREETTLRAKPGDIMLPPDVFTNGVGNFWRIVDTRDYMRARCQAADALVKAHTWLSVQKALEHFLDMLRLCRGDNMGVRDLVPPLMMRLGQEQECYDFLKWWATCDPDGTYDWGDTTLPYLNIRNADPFESIEPFRSHALSLSQLSTLTLLKLSLHLDLCHMRKVDEDGGLDGLLQGVSDPGDKENSFDRPVGNLARAWMQQPENRRNVSEMETRLKAQYIDLIGIVHKQNSHFWETLLKEKTPTPPLSYSMGSQEEADLAVFQGKAAWNEICDALTTVKADTAKYSGK